MQPSVLIPEGKSDFHLLRTILRFLTLSDGWEALLRRPFGVEVGIVPTEDAKVVETYEALSRMHPKICCLVDGDGAGIGYVATLQALPTQPAAIIRWHDGSMVEDVVGWILMGAGEAFIPTLEGFGPFDSIGALVQYLKEKKVDLVAYEALASLIATTEGCRQRAADLFSSLGSAIAGEASPRFSANQGVWVFQP
jgi:hypothetical protein